MTIKTKFNIGDTIFVLFENEIIERKITKIIAVVERDEPELYYEFILRNRDCRYYGVYDTGETLRYPEEEIFKTKKQLANWLAGE